MEKDCYIRMLMDTILCHLNPKSQNQVQFVQRMVIFLLGKNFLPDFDRQRWYDNTYEHRRKVIFFLSFFLNFFSFCFFLKIISSKI